MAFPVTRNNWKAIAVISYAYSYLAYYSEVTWGTVLCIQHVLVSKAGQFTTTPSFLVRVSWLGRGVVRLRSWGRCHMSVSLTQGLWGNRPVFLFAVNRWLYRAIFFAIVPSLGEPQILRTVWKLANERDPLFFSEIWQVLLSAGRPRWTRFRSPTNQVIYYP